MSRNTVIKAEREVIEGLEPTDRLRAPGGGDKPLTEKQPGLLETLDNWSTPPPGATPCRSALDLQELDQVGRRTGPPGLRGSSRTVLRLCTSSVTRSRPTPR